MSKLCAANRLPAGTKGVMEAKQGMESKSVFDYSRTGSVCDSARSVVSDMLKSAYTCSGDMHAVVVAVAVAALLRRQVTYCARCTHALTARHGMSGAAGTAVGDRRSCGNRCS